MKRRRFIKVTGTALSIGAIGLAGCTQNGNENNGNADFPSQDIKWIVPFSSGGGFDTYSRGAAEFLPSYLPNEVEITVENQPGAGGQTGTNNIYRAEPDGYTIGIANIPGLVSTQLIQDTQYDLTKMSWIGRIASDSYVLCVRSDTEHKTLQDLQNADSVSFATTDLSATSGLVALIGSEEMGINAEFVTGYEGSSEAIVGVIRGDADARMTTWANAETPVKDGELRPIIVMAKEVPEWGSDLPTVIDEGQEAAALGLERPVCGPPDLDEETLATLEESLLDTLESNEMKEWAKDQDRELAPAGTEETKQIIEDSINTFEQYKDNLEREFN